MSKKIHPENAFNGAKLVIGWRELASFPEWGVENIPAKMDTGAKSTAIDVDNLEELPNGRIRFDIVLHRTHRNRCKTVTAKVTRTTRVRSSNGQSENRYLVETKLRIGPITQRVEVSLVSRHDMISRTLIGRSSLEDAFLVDSKHKYLIKKRASHKTNPKGS